MKQNIGFISSFSSRSGVNAGWYAEPPNSLSIRSDGIVPMVLSQNDFTTGGQS